MIDNIFYVLVLIMSVVIHEFSHGYMAYRLGDDTARLRGRLTLNPIKHLDLFGSIILPLSLILMKTGIVIGWAKPVPYNPNNLRNGRKGDFLVAISGVLANLIVAIIFGLVIRFGPQLGLPLYLSNSFDINPIYNIASIIVLTNLVLTLFNLVPVPPLDGSKILFSLLPLKFRGVENFFERWGIFLLIFFIIFVWDKVSPLIYFVFSLLTGLG